MRAKQANTESGGGDVGQGQWVKKDTAAFFPDIPPGVWGWD